MAYHWLDMYLIVPAEDTLGETIWDMIYAMDKWSNYVEAIVSTRPTSNFTLSLGSLELDFRSQVEIAWWVVANSIEGLSLVLMMGQAMFGRTVWHLGKWAASWITIIVTFRYMELRARAGTRAIIA